MDGFFSNLTQGLSGGHVQQQGSTGNVHSMTNYIPEDLLNELQPGDTFQGEIMAVSGQEVQLALTNGQVMTAKLEAQIQLALGQLLNFEVQSNENARLVLKPVYTNLLQQQVGEAALRTAHLAVNDKNMQLVSSMIENGMSIDKNSLPKLYRQMVNFPDTPIDDILQLNKLKIPVTEGNLAQYESYRNLSYKLTEGIQATADEVISLYDTLSQSAAEGVRTPQTAVTYMDNVVRFLLDGLQDTVQEQNVTTQQGTVAQENGLPQNMTAETAAPTPQQNVLTQEPTMSQEGQPSQPATAALLTNDSTAAAPEQPVVIIREGESQQLVTPEQSGKEPQAPFTHENVSAQDGQPIPTSEPENTAAKAKLTQQLTDFLSMTPEEKETAYRSEPFRKAVSDALDQNWTMTPEEVAKDGEITHFYRKLSEQSEQLSKLMQEASGNSASGESARNIQQNVEFMNDLNQTLQYVQIPLMMSGNKANGELYVYSNKRHLARKDGTITALLRLDMEHLGPMDFRLSLDTASNILTTHVSLQEEYMDFLESHISELTQRLEQAGYQCKTYIEPRVEQDKTVLEQFEEQIPNGSVRLNYQSFDIKA